MRSLLIHSVGTLLQNKPVYLNLIPARIGLLKPPPPLPGIIKAFIPDDWRHFRLLRIIKNVLMYYVKKMLKLRIALIINSNLYSVLQG